jgi:15-cis-phytoene synthase
MPADVLVEQLPVHLRLALSYAPASARLLTLGLMALDCRLADVVRGTRETLLGQVRLAWWRDRLGEEPKVWPDGEPLLALLRQWHGEIGTLSGLVDGWEGLLGDPPLSGKTLEQFAVGRASAFGGLARLLGADPDEAMRAARGWALVDLSGKLGDPMERAVSQDLAEQHDWRQGYLPRSLRPLAVLHGLARRALLRGDGDLLAGGGAGLVALRLGLLGR